jgi:GNAT superfamily N-acetyltransferase
MPDYVVTSDQNRIDVDAAHRFLVTSYWSPGVPYEVVKRAIANSLCFAVLHGGKQVAFARVVTDKATFAYLADVYVLEEHRGRGLSKRLMQAMKEHPDLQGLRRVLLATRDAHSLYSQFGFRPLVTPDRFMEINVLNAYSASEH